MQTPDFSIIIPMYNVESFITRAIKSAINQSYENIEIICVDDCGNDKSAKIAKEFALQDSRIKVLQNPHNLGTFATRNNGALSANGEYLLFLDGDDFLHKDTCQKCYEILENANRGGQNIDIIAFNHYVVNATNAKDKRVLYPQTQLFSIKDFVPYIAKRGIGKYWALWGKAFLRTTYIKSLQRLDLNKRLLVAEDALNFVNMLFFAKSYGCIADELYHYCENTDSIMQRKDVQKLNITLQNHRFVIDTLLAQSKHFSPLCQNLAKIFALELEISNINFAKRKLNKNALNYLKTSFYKKFLRFKQRYFVYKFCNLKDI